MKQLLVLMILFGHFTLSAQTQDTDSPWEEPEEKESAVEGVSPSTEYDWSWKTSTIPTTPPPPPVPIDGGTGLLLVAGIGYGVREMSRRRKKFK